MAGFHCDYQAPIISLQGAASLFEQFFQMDLEIKKQDKGFYAVAKTKAVIPTQLKNIVTDIVFPEPVELF